MPSTLKSASAVSMVGDSWPFRNATSITGRSAGSASRYQAFCEKPGYCGFERYRLTSARNFPWCGLETGYFTLAEVSRYLANAKLSGHSAKAWYLLAEAADLPVIEVAFLNGQESPTIETAEADFNVLGIQMRGYHDFGCALQDPRGGLKAKGEA